MFDGDPHARVKDRDRDRATYVIDAALRNGQISQQDRDLRVERVRSAATVGELVGLTRDIAAPPAPVPATAVVPPVVVTAPTVATPPLAGVPADLYGPAPSTKRTVAGKGTTTKPRQAGRKVALGCALIVALFVIVPIAAGVIIFTAQTKTGPGIVETDPIQAGPPFELTGAGIRAYVAAFDETFDDTRVVRSVFYDGYVVSWVPQDDGKVALWNYREGAFEQLGDPMSDAVDTGPVDLADLKPGKVMALVREAGSTLGVEQPATTYVIYDRDLIDDTPHVTVYLSNADSQSGYLVGDLDGNVLSTSAAS